MNKILAYYSFILVSIMSILGFLSAKSPSETITSIFFFPVAFYFGLIVFPNKNHAILIPQAKLKNTQSVRSKKSVTEENSPNQSIKLEKLNDGIFDDERRKFIKLIGSAGLSIFLFSIFTKKAHAAFFGSVPGPGTIALKDTSGSLVDPAISSPTDGYKITEIDDNTPAYYGFVDKSGRWFIMQESSGGAYRYTKGSSDFTNATTGWPNRVNLTYGYYDSVF